MQDNTNNNSNSKGTMTGIYRIAKFGLTKVFNTVDKANKHVSSYLNAQADKLEHKEVDEEMMALLEDEASSI